MKKNKENITLVTVCDNHFAVMLAALLKSILTNQNGTGLFSLYIVDDGISRKNRRRLDSIIMHTANFGVNWLPIKKAFPSNIELPLDGSAFPLSVYARICIPYFLPDTVEKAIYLDADTLVENGLEELWNVDMSGYGLAAVTDKATTVSTRWAGIKNYAALGIPADSLYFNTGVLIMDLKKWREEDIPSHVFKCIKENIKYATFPDQYGLNVYFANKWLALPAHWNSYAQDDIIDPKIIHFTGMKPIYRGYQFNQAYKRRFFEYLSSTPFRKFKPKSSYFRLLSKMMHVLEKKQSALTQWIREVKVTLSP
ncbi:glycosyltransferase family 8 protein [Parapedobacter sp. 10938]|uniref:glycosyltransferase family 8 protein n=1 Tax=Parapedobacter flavus TaxID=3110225 RepID=UPI002DBAEA82|nr:glycosyltransferase family 8 protein [Parapedobacter sp. 10938]MEC3879887.1 glycosyltransferase family 8 protein [Parapedobacter sp. 10938]